jgi:hypothetical protein
MYMARRRKPAKLLILGTYRPVDMLGEPEDGGRALAEALALVEGNGERQYEAELYRLYGELLLRMEERETGRTGEEEKIAHPPIHPILPIGSCPP